MSVTEAPRAATNTIEVENPATGKVIASVPVVAPEDVAALAERARRAQPGWDALGFDGRAAGMKSCQKGISDNAGRVIETIQSETGKAYEEALVAEIGYAEAAFRFWATNAEKYLAEEKVRSASPFVKGRKLIVRYAPLGVVGVIGPWNYPLTNSFGDSIPAMMAGNSVLLKPSEVTPLTSMLMGEMLRECGLPEDVYQVIPGYGETAEAIIDEVDVVMFTGSTATGRKVMERAARTLTPVSLELGGKDPMIVCADADVERAANAAAYYGLNNAGQVCISVERVYVEAPIYDEFVGRLVEKGKELRQGAPTAPGESEVGAITSPPQVEIIDAHVRDARDKGASVLTGGRARDGDGRFYEPTVIVGVDHTMACMRDETFGPTIPVMRVADTEEAIRLANDSPYGLQASVFSRDRSKAAAIARRLECGAVCINDAQVNYTVFDAPMGGWKSSGVGSRHGAGGIRKYCKTQTIV